MTEQYPPYEPDETYEWDYDDRPRGNGKVLWGRVLALAVALFLAFLLGRTTAPAEGVPASQLRDREARIEELEDEVAELEAFIEEPTPEATSTSTTTATEATAPEEEGQTYVVKRGDTLRGIAQTFCGDPDLDDVIAEYNDIPDPADISVGTELIIPPDCGE